MFHSFVDLDHRLILPAARRRNAAGPEEGGGRVEGAAPGNMKASIIRLGKGGPRVARNLASWNLIAR